MQQAASSTLVRRRSVSVKSVLDDEEGRHNQFSHGKFFGITSPSDADEVNRREGKETTYDRTRRLLYVCCSRAGKDLAVVYFANDPAAAHSAIASLGLFPAEDVHNLAANWPRRRAGIVNHNQN